MRGHYVDLPAYPAKTLKDFPKFPSPKAKELISRAEKQKKAILRAARGS